MATTHTTAPFVSADMDLADFQVFRQFALEYERLGLGTENSLRWLFRHRRENGLLASGAVIELKSPGRTRPKLIVHRPRFAAWLAAQSLDA